MKTPFISLLATFCATCLHAASVQFAGVITDDSGLQISQWRTPTALKSLDPDGDNVFGTIARLYYGVSSVVEGNGFQYASSHSTVGPLSGYIVTDHPSGGADLQVKTTRSNGVAAVDEVMLTFTALAGTPSNVRIGIATDGLDSAAFSPATIGLRQVNGRGASAEHTLTAVNRTIDMVFFDVIGVTAGDQFQVFGDSGTGNFTTHQFVTWDEVSPFVGFTGSHNLTSGDPLLAPLGNYGGGTQTRALLSGSPARNAAVGSTISTDQRGFPIVGIPDLGAYESANFSNYNAWIWESLPSIGNGTVNDPLHAGTFDLDGDGQSNLNEWIARTDPLNSSSSFRILQHNFSAGNFEMTFPSIVGRSYQVQSSPSLAAAWTNVGTAVLGTGGNITLATNVSGAARFFYRVVVGDP